MTNLKINRNKKSTGQSLVELAISLPLFMFLIAGIVEVGNLLVQRQRITTAVDQGVRFGSRGGSDEGIYISALTTLTQTMPIDNPELWDVFVVRGKVNAAGDGWEEFSLEHAYGNRQTSFYTETISSLYTDTIPFEDSLEGYVLDGLTTRARVDPNTGEVLEIIQGSQEGRNQSQRDEVVGMIVGHKAETILGIQSYFGQDVVLSSEKYMTIHAVGGQTDGCDLYPIGINLSVRNLPSQESPQGETYYEQTSNSVDPVFSVGDLAKYDFPADPPLWDAFRPRSGIREVTSAIEGDVYVLNEGSDFRWAKWTNTSIAAGDLAWPGSSDTYDSYGGEFPDLSPGGGVHIGDRIKYDDVAINAWPAIQDHITVGRSLRLPIMGADGGDNFKVGGFIILKLIGYSNDGDGIGGNNFIVAEVVRIDTSCGQVVE